MDHTHLTRGDESRERLRALATWLSDADLARPMGDGWTVAAAFAHIAFWDRFVLARWERHLRDGGPVVSLSDDLLDLVNAAALDQWLALPVRAAVRSAVDAAEAVDRTIATLPAETVEA
ncbi:MAG: DinB family protein, partial [Chloroflexia bacterium]|nr:DinB family protein [Chloroflexia bacterium]